MLLYCVDVLHITFVGNSEGVITGSTIKVLRERIFASFSVPQVIIIDGAKCFVIRIFCDFYFTSRIQHVTKLLFSTAI